MWHIDSVRVQNFLSHVDTTFDFDKNRAVIICGNNLDDDAQKGNGTGKSALTEGISLAFTGNTIRSVTAKDLVRDGEDESTLTVTLSNDKSEEFIVERAISVKKAARVTLKLNGEEISDLTSVNEATQRIFDILGITKDDFFNFYLITKEKYVPFLAASDTKKKEIIMRFSGADRIDGVFDILKEQRAVVETRLRRLETEQATKEGALEVVQQDIAELSTSEAIEEWRESLRNPIRQRISEYEQDIEREDRTLSEIEEKKAVAYEELKHCESAIVDAKDDINECEELIKTEKAKLNKKHAKLEKEIKKLIAQTENDRAAAEGLESSIKEAKSTENELKDFLAEANRMLQGEITCPKCSHKFFADNDEVDVVEIEEAIRDTESEIAKLAKKRNVREKQLNDLFDKINGIDDKISEMRTVQRTAQAAFDAAKKTLDNQIDQQSKKLRELQARQVKLQNQDGDLAEKIATRIKRYEEQVSKEQEKLAAIDKRDPYDGKLEELNRKVEAFQQGLDEYTEQIDNIVNVKLGKLIEWTMRFKAFKSYLANKSIGAMMGFANLYLESIGSGLEVEISGFTQLKSGELREKISANIFRDGINAGLYGRFSGGERGRIDICVDLGIQQLINMNTETGGLNFLLYDEALDSIDSLGLEKIVRAFSSVGHTISLITQNTIDTLNQHMVLVEKEDGVSRIVKTIDDVTETD